VSIPPVPEQVLSVNASRRRACSLIPAGHPIPTSMTESPGKMGWVCLGPRRSALRGLPLPTAGHPLTDESISGFSGAADPDEGPLEALFERRRLLDHIHLSPSFADFPRYFRSQRNSDEPTENKNVIFGGYSVFLSTVVSGTVFRRFAPGLTGTVRLFPQLESSG